MSDQRTNLQIKCVNHPELRDRRFRFRSLRLAQISDDGSYLVSKSALGIIRVSVDPVGGRAMFQAPLLTIKGSVGSRMV